MLSTHILSHSHRLTADVSVYVDQSLDQSLLKAEKLQG